MVQGRGTEADGSRGRRLLCDKPLPTPLQAYLEPTAAVGQSTVLLALNPNPIWVPPSCSHRRPCAM